MSQNDPVNESVDEDEFMKSQMEQMVDSYDAYMRKVTFGREGALREMTVKIAPVKPGDCVLEVGCGTGSLTLAAKKQAGTSGKVFGIDIIPGMIELSRQKAAQANEEITFQLGSIADIPFPANQFDVVMCSFMIFHMSEMTRRKNSMSSCAVL
jgi:ubiquinone/menaquinone biosynthesis C-methylase UbiE